MIVIVSGWSAPAPSPWITRKAISASIDEAVPQRTEPITKRPIPNAKSGLRP